MSNLNNVKVQRETFINSSKTGFITGILLPTCFFFLTYFTKYADIPFDQYIQTAMDKGAMVYLLSISAFPNLLLFFLANQLNKNLFCKGMVAISVVWIVVIFILKGYFWMTL
ncbi:MAG: hypothetical protein ACPGSG_10455 [Prolixibacteraceae bacterium]|jgi:hypothetical protein|nr:hypothetical protein [Prolixibacteraceae bacterium]